MNAENARRLGTLDIETSNRSTHAFNRDRPRDAQFGDRVVGEFVGDLERLVVRCDAGKADFGHVLVALPASARAQGYGAAESLASFRVIRAPVPRAAGAGSSRWFTFWRIDLATVHVFVSTGKFRTFKQAREFIDETYDESGEPVSSPFIEEVTLDEYEPGCIEAIVSDAGPVPVKQLLTRASYSDQWLPQLATDKTADAAICVFAPNEVETPERSSLDYLGAFEYRP